MRVAFKWLWKGYGGTLQSSVWSGLPASSGSKPHSPLTSFGSSCHLLPFLCKIMMLREQPLHKILWGVNKNIFFKFLTYSWGNCSHSTYTLAEIQNKKECALHFQLQLLKWIPSWTNKTKCVLSGCLVGIKCICVIIQEKKGDSEREGPFCITCL